MYIEVNESFCSLLGYGKDEVIGKTVQELGIMTLNAKQAILENADADGKTLNIEADLIAKDGKIKNTLLSAENIYIQERKLRYTVVVDITERKRMEETIQKSEHFINAALSALSAHIAILDESGVIVSVNRAWRIFAAANSDGVSNLCEGANYLAVCDVAYGADSKESAEFAAGIRSVLKEERDSFELEYPCHSPNEKRWFLGRVTRFESDGSVSLIIAHENITVSKLAEEKIIRSNKELAFQNREKQKRTEELIVANNALGEIEKKLQNNYAILNSIFESPQNIIIFSLDTRYRYKAFTNFHKRTMKKIWGVDIEIGMNMLEVMLDPDDRAKAKNNFDRVLGGEYLRFEEEYGDPKLYRACYENIYNPIIDINGDILGLAVFVIDITDRKRAESIIQRQNNQLQELNATKDKFFSIIAHDLRSPFMGLLGLTEMMASGNQELSLEEYAKFSESLRAAVVNLYKLLENLLEWAMLQKGSIAFLPVKLNVSDMVLTGIDTIKERALRKGITISSGNLDVAEITADEKMISAILRNLLANAVKFTRKGGEITVRAEKTEEGMAKISVTDTGVGIPKNVIDRLFILGEKVGRTGTESEPSTGLGLILCKEFIEKHGGKIWVESQEGVGSAFYFTVPASGK